VITSPNNEKLKLIRSLRARRHREREGLFLTEGEDLFEAGIHSGAEPRLLLSAAGSGIGGLEVEPELLARSSTLGSGTRVIAAWAQRWSPRIEGPVCVYLHEVGDPANVGAVIRSAHALVEGTVVLGPGCADPFSPKAVRASMGSIFSEPVSRGTVSDTPAPRLALLAHGGGPPTGLWPEVHHAGTTGRGGEAAAVGLPSPLTVCLGAEREGLPQEVVEACQHTVTIPLQPGVESLNVAAAAAIVLQGISSRAPVARGMSTSEGDRNG
jgi:RNA methyltransferase, TrmH family